MNEPGVIKRTVKTTCPYCGVGCGVLVTQEGNKPTVMGDPEHSANYGRLCSKGSTLADTLGTTDRLLYPMISGERASWDTAIDTIADKFTATINKYGSEAVALYVSGQILTEDYYVANKLMKGFIGTANIDTNSRLCMASSVAGHKRAFGGDIVPGCYEDLELADVVVLVGSNLAWCHPVIFQRLLAAREARPEMKIVVLDPRKTATTELADMHIQLKSGSDVDLFMGLTRYLLENDCTDKTFIDNHTNNYESLVGASENWDLITTVEATGVSIDILEAFFELFSKTEKTVTVYSQGVNQATDGTDRVNCIINCHLMTGRIGRPGMGPFSITGQPNAMGGREVGGLANQLASHMSLESVEDRDRVKRFWNAPTVADQQGLKAVDLFDAVERGDIKAIWIMATNPVVSMPDADRVKAALKACDLVIVSDVTPFTDTAECADILLPSLGWGEKDGMVTNSERRMSRQRSFMAAPGEARADWKQICNVATAMGWGDAFNYRAPHEIFNEYTALSSFENNNTRALDFTDLDAFDLESYNEVETLQWPISAQHEKSRHARNKRLFADGDFYTHNRRANFVVPAAFKQPINRRNPVEGYPFILNTGRIRDHWHTMTRTGKAPKLSDHISEPFVEVSVNDAKTLNLKDADLARIRSPYGQIIVRVLITDKVEDGNIFVPIHWNNQFAAKARVDTLVAPVIDPVSGQPALKSTYANVEKYDARVFGFAVFNASNINAIVLDDLAGYWVKAPAGDQGVRLEVAGETLEISALCDRITSLISDSAVNFEAAIECLEYSDSASGNRRFGFYKGGLLLGLFYVANEPVLVSRSWAISRIGKAYEGLSKLSVLAGTSSSDMPDIGAIVCSCMNVGVNQITAALASGCKTVDAVSHKTSAGTNCGSCRSDITRLLREKIHA